MKLLQKLEIKKRNAYIAKGVYVLIMIYTAMVFIKGAYWDSEGSNMILADKIYYLTSTIIEKTYFFPVSSLWNHIPAFPFDFQVHEKSFLIEFYKAIAPPIFAMIVSALFVADYRKIKKRYDCLLSEVDDEIERNRIREAKGIKNIPENSELMIRIESAEDNEPAWHKKLWGKVVIAVVIAGVLAVIGLK